ncbi:MAG: DegQ family serine endoprotease [Chlamydiales bacterium]|nr:DegQ family serine endoprotease [Chlamydiia bacterium]MCP5507064.1 DegQ family serine endoprotease [Chlamydiales bacterium]
MKIRHFLPLFASVLMLSQTVAIAEQSQAAQQVSRDFTTVAENAIPAVVSISVKGQDRSTVLGDETQDPLDLFQDDFFRQFFGGPRRRRFNSEQQQPIAQASGFIVSPDGYILTNNHVIRQAGQITVLLNDGRELEGKVIGQDDNTDLAVIKIDADNLPYINLGNSDDLKVGQWVVAIGNPLGLQASLTVGVVSAKGRNNLDLATIEDFIQTDAAINRGNSGGPLLNLDGEVIGINTAIVSNSGTGGYMGIGFAIPSNMAEYVMQQLINDGSVKRGYLGVTLQNVDQNLATAFGLDKVEGALIADVVTGSPAAKAGIHQGDIVVNYDGKRVNNLAALRNAVSMMAPGKTISLDVLRDGKMQTIPVEIGTFPNAVASAAGTDDKLGIEVQAITPEVAQNLGLIDDKGVVITKVKPGSPASWAGLKKGAVIVAVNQQKIASADEFRQAIERTDSGKPVLLLIKQGDIMRYVSFKVG